MKIRLSEVPVGDCFLGKKDKILKKLEDGKVVNVNAAGRVSTKKSKGDPEVEMTMCPLSYLGVGLRRHPDLVVEIGDGNILKKRKR